MTDERQMSIFYVDSLITLIPRRCTTLSICIIVIKEATTQNQKKRNLRVIHKPCRVSQGVQEVRTIQNLFRTYLQILEIINLHSNTLSDRKN